MNYTGAVECEPCPAGFYCVIAGTTVICPAGKLKRKRSAVGGIFPIKIILKLLVKMAAEFSYFSGIFFKARKNLAAILAVSN